MSKIEFKNLTEPVKT